MCSLFMLKILMGNFRSSKRSIFVEVIYSVPKYRSSLITGFTVGGNATSLAKPLRPQKKLFISHNLRTTIVLSLLKTMHISENGSRSR